jgi:gas vesicle protein
MAYREESGGASFVLGVMTGAVIGAGVALLFAPKTGQQTRELLGEQYRGLASRIGESTETLRQQGRERINQFTNQLSDRVTSAADRLSAGAERLTSTSTTSSVSNSGTTQSGVPSSAPSV